MRIIHVLTTAAGLASVVSANFHIGKADKVQLSTNPDRGGGPPLKYTRYIACPSNYLNCKCYGGFADNSDRGVGLASGSSLSRDFSLKGGLCGTGQLDFYYRPNLGHWEFYVNGGNGDIQGTCYKNSDSLKGCGIGPHTVLETNYSDQLVCYSYICGN
ncbi:hypothetical protein NQ176_g945 [Zarea fungicola]|uniref:Uncharacterized protein n=1 Tax=Zarea fungicola TaxID=93591 RepID=A0ACC1NX67_9HYPO|nr:hypothetical protein NQ176_g945 [Lecanicillium fungicola]